MIMKKVKIILSISLWFVVLTGCERDPNVPIGKDSKIEIRSFELSSITQFAVSATADIVGGGEQDVIDKGVCWALSSDPTVLSDKRSLGAGAGEITASIINLVPGTTYFVRAYFQTKQETIYSKSIQFRTVGYQLATVITNSVSNVTMSGAVATATVNGSGGGTVTARGFCWNTSGMPTTAANVVVSGTGLGAFAGQITPLTAGTIYYVRPFAINQAGTSYGSQISFTTLKLATVGLLSVSSIGRNSVNVSGLVSSDGGSAITSRGICYATNTTNPTIASNAYTNNGSGTGNVGGTIFNLTAGTTYYIRSYAVSAAGASYGVVTMFRTLF